MMFCQDAALTFVLFHHRPAGGALGFPSDVFIMDAVGGGDMNLGELADLTVANDNDLSMDVIMHFIFSGQFPGCNPTDRL